MEDSRQSTVAPLRFNRRRIVQGAAAGLTATALPAQMLTAADRQVAWSLWQEENPDATPASVEDYEPVALTAAEWATLTAIVDRFFPQTETTPSGVETGAHIYIDRKLGTAYAENLPDYQTGLAAIESSIDGGFSASDPDTQDATLRDVEGGMVTDVPDGFFDILLDHTRQGMFCDPIHGGNREFMGWDMIGYPGIKLLWTADEQAINTGVEPAYISVEQYGGTAR